MAARPFKKYKGFQSVNVFSIHEGIFNNEANYAKLTELFWKCSSYDEISRELATGHFKGQKTPDDIPYTRCGIRLAIQHHVRESRKSANTSRNLARFSRSQKWRANAEQRVS